MYVLATMHSIADRWTDRHTDNIINATSILCAVRSAKNQNPTVSN